MLLSEHSHMIVHMRYAPAVSPPWTSIDDTPFSTRQCQRRDQIAMKPCPSAGESFQSQLTVRQVQAFEECEDLWVEEIGVDRAVHLLNRDVCVTDDLPAICEC